MDRLIVLDASVAIAALASDDAHHAAALTALAGLGDSQLVIAATTRAEILVGPSRAGGIALAAARDFVDGCETVPVTAAIADDAAAEVPPPGAQSSRRHRARRGEPDRRRRRVDL